MKGILFSLLFSVLPFQYAQAIQVWHSDTVWVGQGMCSATIMFDSGGEEIIDLKVAITAVDSENNDVDAFVVHVPMFGDSSASRFYQEFWESDTACEDSLKLKITLATAVINNQKVDLLRTNGIFAREFKPFEIQVGN